MLATNELLQRIFSKNTIDDNTLFAPGNVIIINASKGAVGDQVSFLIMAGWLFKIWYYALARAQLNMERIPVIIAIDEFQNIADLSLIDTVLAEARKYGMHLLLAHQHTGQIDMNLLKSLMSNTVVKFLMKMQGSDAEKFAEIFPEFKNELVKILPSQSVGQATIIITPRKPDDKIIPIRTNIDWEDFKKDPKSITNVIERMKKYEAQDVSEADVTAILNPILKYVEEKPDVLAKLILYETFKSSCENGNHCIALVDLVRKLGVDREKVEDAVNKLEAHGYISVEKIKGKKVLQYGKGLFPLKGIVENEVGKKVALRVISKLYKEGLVVVAGKQQGDVRPDFVAFPYDRETLRPRYDEAIAVEIESPNELSTHSEQVKRNMLKYLNITDLFKEIRLYTDENGFEKLKKIYDEFMADTNISTEYKQKVKIFSVKIKQKVKQEAPKEKKTKPETGEFTERKPESKESKQETVPALAQGAPNNANSKLGSLQKDGVIELQLQGNIIRINKIKNTIEINGEEYKIPSFEIRPIINRKDNIIAISKKEKKIIIAYDNGDTSEIDIIS